MKLATKASFSLRSRVYGIGINDADYVTTMSKKNGGWRCPFYYRWEKMLRRCYSEHYQKINPSYIGCSVCPEWLYFSKFRLWMVTQNWEGLELDKDLLVVGNRVYSPDTCCFISHKINTFFTSAKPYEILKNKSGTYTIYYIKGSKKLQKTSNNIKELHIIKLQSKIQKINDFIITDSTLEDKVIFALNDRMNLLQEQINNI